MYIHYIIIIKKNKHYIIVKANKWKLNISLLKYAVMTLGKLLH